MTRREKWGSQRRPWEFSKRLAAWAVAIATASAVMSYLLALFGRETAGDVTTTIFTACTGYLITYAAKSATEKVSRNRHGLDADGKPYEDKEDGPNA